MTQPRVFVVHHQPGRNINIRPARRHGELVPLFVDDAPGTAQEAVNILHEQLADYDGARDFLLPVGSPELIAWAAAVAAGVSGRVQLLIWDQDSFTYRVRCATVWDDDAEALQK